MEPAGEIDLPPGFTPAGGGGGMGGMMGGGGGGMSQEAAEAQKAKVCHGKGREEGEREKGVYVWERLLFVCQPFVCTPLLFILPPFLRVISPFFTASRDGGAAAVHARPDFVARCQGTPCPDRYVGCVYVWCV